MTNQYDPQQLPAPVRDYAEGHHRHDFDLAMTAITDDTVVTDDGKVYTGRSAIRAWLERATAEWTYTQEYVAQQQVSPTEWVVTNHLEGNFPGGVVDLQFRFVVADDKLASLPIAP
ncbi:nuclear transport factor 2 family protein [Nocardioides sp. TF02-7]|uniref:nuclear transport factor 2 family protein n=1 Tax=Nocardioides sp. TF02-7 TaxID=2917724 RepID=UPI001F053D7D|nr:nuclear transport factor 2 family protein [Nocardioides sp. TF02-7]UMG94402.1 nuclear transport factor 2 family protein [Nocardioides sp. TF02-7]